MTRVLPLEMLPATLRGWLQATRPKVLFLELMIRHHQGGVDMAQAVLDRSDNAQTEVMASRTVLLQETDISTMNQMLEVRGQEPITDPLPTTDEHSDH